mgnify:CR=1 FL=1
MEDNQLVQKILQDYKSELMGYKQISVENLKENTFIKYYNLKTKHLSKRVSVQRIHYFSEITKTMPMKLEVYSGNDTMENENKHYWNVICKNCVIFKQYHQVSKLRRFCDEYLL